MSKRDVIVQDAGSGEVEVFSIDGEWLATLPAERPLSDQSGIYEHLMSRLGIDEPPDEAA